MALEIFKLVGSVFVDTDAAEKSLKKTDEKAESLGKKFVKGVGTAAKWGAGVVAAAGAGAAALYGVANSAASAMDVIDKGSAKIGISKKAYQEWSYVLGQNGVDIGKLETGMKSLVSKMGSASEGVESACGNFDALGVSIYDASGGLKDQEVILKDTLYALAEMENGTEKARMATELFGKAGVEMMPMLNNGAEGMTELTERAHELGLVVSDEAVTAGVVLGDTISDVKQSFGTVINKIGVELMPVIQSVLDWILSNMPMIQGVCAAVFGAIEVMVSWVGGIFQSVFDGISGAVTNSGVTIQTVFDFVKNIFETAMVFLQAVWDTIGKPVFDFIMQAVDLVRDYFAERMPAIRDFVGDAFKDIKSFWDNNLKPCFKAIGDFISNVLAPVFQKVFKGIIAPLIDSVFKTIKGLWTNFLKPVFVGITDFISGVFTLNFKKAFQGIVDIVGAIFKGIIEVVKTPLNWIIDGINWFIKGLNKIKIPDWVPGVGGYGLNIPTIPRLEKGGILEKGQVGFLEGNGAEAVVPLENNKRWVSKVAQDMDAAIGGISGGQVVAILADILTTLENVAGMGITLDTGALVGGLAKPLDRRLGQLRAQKARV